MGRYSSDFLFAQPSLLSGAARVLDLFGRFDGYNVSTTPEDADDKALRSDWGVVGQDLKQACDSEVASRTETSAAR